MIIKVEHRRQYGKDLFYPTDSWTMKFLEATRLDLPKKTFTLAQITAYKLLGFEIEVTQNNVIISEVMNGSKKT